MTEEERALFLAALDSELLRPRPAACTCGEKLDRFLHDLHEELQSGDRILLTLNLPWTGRISLHWSRE